MHWFDSLTSVVVLIYFSLKTINVLRKNFGLLTFRRLMRTHKGSKYETGKPAELLEELHNLPDEL